MTYTRLPGHVCSGPDQIEILYLLGPASDEPRFDVEGLWSTRLSEDTARIENSPGVVEGVARGDIVDFSVNEEDGTYWAGTRRIASGALSVRLIPRPNGKLRGLGTQTVEFLAPLDLPTELLDVGVPLIALHVPPEPEAVHAHIRDFLEHGHGEGWWDFEITGGKDE